MGLLFKSGRVDNTSITGLLLSCVMLALAAIFIVCWIWVMLRAVVIGYRAERRMKAMASAKSAATEFGGMMAIQNPGLQPGRTVPGLHASGADVPNRASRAARISAVRQTAGGVSSVSSSGGLADGTDQSAAARSAVKSVKKADAMNPLLLASIGGFGVNSKTGRLVRPNRPIRPASESQSGVTASPADATGTGLNPLLLASVKGFGKHGGRSGRPSAAVQSPAALARPRVKPSTGMSSNITDDDDTPAVKTKKEHKKTRLVAGSFAPTFVTASVGSGINAGQLLSLESFAKRKRPGGFNSALAPRTAATAAQKPFSSGQPELSRPAAGDAPAAATPPSSPLPAKLGAPLVPAITSLAGHSVDIMGANPMVLKLKRPPA